MIKLRSTLLAAVLLTAVAGGAAYGLRATSASAASVSAGDLVRGTSLPAVYYVGADGFRYVFPNFKTYNTWYSDFSTVKTISDTDLGKIQMGGNVTYKPGVRMIKIDSDPKVYYVSMDGELFWVADEATAQSLYGSTWNKQIDDVPDGFFANYTLSDEEVSDSDVSAVKSLPSSYSINDDKSLVAPAEISVGSSGYSPLSTDICVGETVRFTNNDSSKHTATADDLSWGSGTMEQGVTFIKRFAEEGTYTFFDGYDSTNTAAIYVEECN